MSRSRYSAFIGHGFHLKYTKSSDFFIELLKSELQPLKVLDSNWQEGVLPFGKWEHLVFWQHLPTPEFLADLDARSVTLVPMYDTCSRDPAYWKEYKGCKVLCFAAALADLVEDCGLETLRVQYYPAIPETVAARPEATSLSAFYWPRSPEINSKLPVLLAGRDWDTLHIHEGQAELSGLDLENIRAKKISRTKWFQDRAHVQQTMARVQVFVAPRANEGIGMSFLEAMALGMLVIAPDRPTMNEYIANGDNGFLYDMDAVPAFDWTKAQYCAQQARTSAERGRKAWEQAVPDIVAFVASPGAKQRQGTGSVTVRKKYARNRVRYILFLAWAPLRWLSRTIRKLKALVERKHAAA